MNLKSIKGSGLDREFAYLIAPSEPVSSDAELYQSVRAYGRAIIRPFEGGSLKLGPPVVLTPEAFEAAWQGD